MAIREFLFSVNKFNRPVSYDDKDALSILFSRLLLLEPGSNPLHPEMGVGLRSRYRYCFVDELDELELEIRKQIEIYLPNYQSAQVSCTVYEGDTRVTITVDDTQFNIGADGSIVDPNNDTVSNVLENPYAEYTEEDGTVIGE